MHHRIPISLFVAGIVFSIFYVISKALESYTFDITLPGFGVIYSIAMLSQFALTVRYIGLGVSVIVFILTMRLNASKVIIKK